MLVRVRVSLTFIAALCAVILTAAACGESEDLPTEGTVVVEVRCAGDGCGPTGDLVTTHQACGGGAVIAATTDAGVTLSSASVISNTFSPIEPGSSCFEAVLYFGTSGRVVRQATGGEIQVTIVHGETFTLPLTLGTVLQ